MNSIFVYVAYGPNDTAEKDELLIHLNAVRDLTAWSGGGSHAAQDLSEIVVDAITQLRQTHLTSLPLDTPEGKQLFVAETQLDPVTASPAERIEPRWPADRPAVVEAFSRRSGRE